MAALVLVGLNAPFAIADDTVAVSGICWVVDTLLAASYRGQISWMADKSGRLRPVGTLTIVPEDFARAFAKARDYAGPDADKFGAFSIQVPLSVDLFSAEERQKERLQAYGSANLGTDAAKFVVPVSCELSVR